MRRWRSAGVAQTRHFGARLAGELAPDGVLLLSGDLGAGKTALAQGLGAALGIDPREIQSPSFTLIRQHEGEAGSLVHVDLYRLEPAGVESLGLDELLAGPGIKVVEWAERLPFEPSGAVHFELRVVSAEERDLIELPPTAERGTAHRLAPREER